MFIVFFPLHDENMINFVQIDKELSLWIGVHKQISRHLERVMA